MEMRQLEQFQPKGELWSIRTKRGKLAAVIDPADTKGRKNTYIDILHKLALSQHLINIKPNITLDLGCGTGRFCELLAPKTNFLIGLEITHQMLKCALNEKIKYPNIKFVLFNGLNLPIKDMKVDLVITVWVLQYVTDTVILQKIISEIKRCLKLGGRVLSIEQVSEKRWQRNYQEYVRIFEANNFKPLATYPIKSGHSLILYLILLGIIPKSWFSTLAKMEIWLRRNNLLYPGWGYEDYLFEMERI